MCMRRRDWGVVEAMENRLEIRSEYEVGDNVCGGVAVERCRKGSSRIVEDGGGGCCGFWKVVEARTHTRRGGDHMRRAQ